MESFDRYRAAGINMTLGTDMWPLEMFTEMRMASIGCKVAEKNYLAIWPAPRRSTGPISAGFLPAPRRMLSLSIPIIWRSATIQTRCGLSGGHEGDRNHHRVERIGETRRNGLQRSYHMCAH